MMTSILIESYKKENICIAVAALAQNRGQTNLPLSSVKSLIPPPTVSGTKTFSDAQRSTYQLYEPVTSPDKGK